MRVLIVGFLLSLSVLSQEPRQSRQPKPDRYRVGTGVAAPRCDYTPDPQYTAAAKKAAVKGTVVLSTTEGADGCLRDIKVVRALGYGLDETAVDAVRGWHCHPAIKNGKPVETKITIELNFDPTWPSSTQSAADLNPCTKRTAKKGEQPSR